MMTNAQATTSKQVLTFASGGLDNGSARSPAAVAAMAATLLLYRWSETFQPPGDTVGSIALIVLLICILLLTIGQRWTVAIDDAARRLTIFRYFILRGTTIVLRTTVLEDCSFDECSEVGVRALNGDGRKHYSVYLNFKRGGRHILPVHNDDLNEAKKAASELSVATGIRFLDAKS